MKQLSKIAEWIKNNKKVKLNHGLVMILCCLIPLGILIALRLFNIQLKGIGYYLIILLCPLMHVFLMGNLFRKNKGEEQNGTDKDSCH